MRTLSFQHLVLIMILGASAGLAAHSPALAQTNPPAEQPSTAAPPKPPAATPETPAATPDPPATAAAADAAADIMNDPDIQAQLKGKTPQEAQVWGAQMSAKGLKRLPYADLVSWNEVRIKMATSSPAVCTGFWKGGIDPAAVQKALTSLGKDDMDRWTAVSTKAMVLEAKNATYPPTSQNDLIEFIKLVNAELKGDEQTRFKTLIAKGTNVTDEEACWMMLALLNHAVNNAAEQAFKEKSLRALAAMGSPS